ncbi:MAG: HAAS signaling domain-containing protein, partial [Planctomycetota bacterium]
MITYTEEAQKHLDKYLNEVRVYLSGCKSVDVEEIQRDIIEHVETELEGATEPISFNDLDAVLEKLGSPRQWVPDEELSAWQKIITRLRTGPEDWRLAYISLGLLILGFIANPVFVLASFVVSRAALSVAGD